MKLEIEFVASHARPVLFPPIDRPLRSKIDFVQLSRTTKGAAELMHTWGDSLPGMRITVDTGAKEATLIEPLHEPAYARVREQIAKKGERLVDARETFSNVDVATWLFWVARLRDSGSVKLVAGSLGTVDQIKAEFGAPRIRSYAPVEPNNSVERLCAIMFSLLSDKQKTAAGELLAAGS